jgi:glucose-1-phosphate adenylyltransferase
MRVTVNVTMTDQDRLQEADRSALGFTIRDGIVVIEKTTTLADRTIIEEPG